MQADLEKIKATGLTIVAISYDSADSLAKFADKKKITFPLLADDGSKTIEAYGLRDPKGKGYSIPGTIIVDKAGIVRKKLFEEGVVKRHSTDALIEAGKAVE